MDLRDRIMINPEVLVGKPVVRGTRIAVELVLDLLSEGVSEEEILENYPRLTHDDILACIQYANTLVKSESVYPLDR